MKIRKATISDACKLKATLEAFGVEAYNEDSLSSRLESLIHSNCDQVWVFEFDGEVAGWVHGVFSVRLTAEPFIEICGLAISAERQGQGIGSMLVRCVTEWAEQERCHIRVRSNEKRALTQKFYEKNGFLLLKNQLVFAKNI